MSEFVIPASDTGADALFLQFKNAMAAHGAGLGYDAVAIDDTIAAYTDFHADLTTVTNTKAAARAAVKSKEEQRVTSSTIVRAYAQQIKNNPLATNAIKTAFGINVTTSATPPVTVPSSLSAAPSASGSCLIRWNKNGNISGTVYLIETKIGDTGEWTFTASSTKASYKDTAATPGVQKSYRVRAQRGSATSEPCSSVTIYNGEGEGFGGLQVAA